MAVPFKNFEDAFKHVPRFIGGLDPVGQHKTIADLKARVEFEMDLATEGEPNEIDCPRRGDTTKRWQVCRAYVARCNAANGE